MARAKIAGSILLSLLLSSSSHAAEDLKVAAAIAAMGSVFKKIQAPFEKSTGIKIVYSGNSDKGIPADQIFKEIDEGTAELGVASSPFESWVALMKEKHYEIKNLSDIKFRVMGKDVINIYTFSDGPKKLSDEQLTKLLTGKVSNWKEIGGPDRAIIFIRAKSQPVTEKYIVDRVLNKVPLRDENSKMAGDSSEMMKMISETPGAFGFGAASLRELFPKVINVPEHRAITRAMTWITKGPPSPKVAKFFEFFKAEAPKLGID